MGARVVVSQWVFPDALDPLREAGFDVVTRDADDALATDDLVAWAADADALICLLTDPIDQRLFEAVPRLRVVANVAVGYDNIDVDAATAAGVAVTNTPGVLTDATADLAFALMLAAARRIPEGDTFLRAGRYRTWKLAQEQLGLDVFGRSLGIVGLGQIGRAVARRAVRGFGMTVRYHNSRRLPVEVESDLGVHWASLDEVLAESDFVSLHAPSTPATRHLIDADALDLMKPTAILVNTARGPLVDEAALAGALARGKIAGAGLDVYEDEPAVHPELLAQRDRVVLLPHVGSATEATRRRMVDVAVANVLDTLQGGRPRTLVNAAVYDDTMAMRGKGD